MKKITKNQRSNKGITLIALIITVIVMLILAGVAINLTVGDNGIFKKTAETVVIHENASVYEQLCLKIVDDELGDRLGNTQTDKLNKLKTDGYVNEDFSVNASVVTKSSMKTGKGSIGSGDVYVLETLEGSEEEYYLMYYNDKNEKRNLGKVFDVGNLQKETAEDYFVFDPETGRIALKGSLGYYYNLAYVQNANPPEIGLKTIVIPAEYEGQTVTEIGGMEVIVKESYGANNTKIYGINATDVEQIIIPETVTRIGENAFLNCGKLKKVVIPTSVTSIGKNAFTGCSNLTEIELPELLTTIENDAFVSCTNLPEITIPDLVTTIGNNAFYGCSNLQRITFSNSLATIGSGAFNGCSSLQEVTIPNSVTTIGNNAFATCRSLQEVIIPNSVTAIGNSTFYNCSNVQKVVIPNSVTTIEYSTFENCSSLQEVTIPDSVTAIGNNAFENCSSLQEVTIPDSVTAIGNNAFENCSSLQRITIPNSVTKMRKSAFSGCSSLQEITIPDSVTTIERYTFSGCSSLERIIIPNSVIKIEYRAFENCTRIQEITIPASVVSVTIYAGIETIYAPFDGWTSTQKINVPFREGELPSGWSPEWTTNCEAQIIYQP